MLFWKRPEIETVRRFLEHQATLDFSYQAVRCTQGQAPPGFVVDHTRIELGRGQATFDAAVAALGHWKQFALGWMETWPADVPLEPGQNVAILARIMGLWWLNACRVVYRVDDEGPIRSFGFAYGTLPGHAEMGEERFVIEWDRAKDEVAFDILAHSRPRHILAKIGYPLVRRMQKRFGREATASLKAATV
jgi:uncharacterized protein (UPF0548 family)